jgi:hypothetical protein
MIWAVERLLAMAVQGRHNVRRLRSDSTKRSLPKHTRVVGFGDAVESSGLDTDDGPDSTVHSLLSTLASLHYLVVQVPFFSAAADSAHR